MSVVEFRASLQGYWKMLTITLRFRNKLGRPVILGYVAGSGGATDDRGNRYVVKDGEVRGIGLISRRGRTTSSCSPRDRRAMPGSPWSGPGRQLFGNTFDLDLTVREIIPAGQRPDHARAGVPAADRRPGRRRAGRRAPRGAGVDAGRPPRRPSGRRRRRTTGAPRLHRTGAGEPEPRPLGVPSPSPSSTPRPRAERTARRARGCYDAGAFSVTVTQTSAAPRAGRTSWSAFSVRVKNHGAQPLVLAYKAGTNAAVDEQGNSLQLGAAGHPRRRASQGIGTLEGARIDPQFQVAPGATRDAQLSVTRFDAGAASREELHPDTVLVELRGHPGGQWQKVREYAVHLPGGWVGGSSRRWARPRPDREPRPEGGRPAQGPARRSEVRRRSGPTPNRLRAAGRSPARPARATRRGAADSGRRGPGG